jgi:hypothetical protein
MQKQIIKTLKVITFSVLLSMSFVSVYASWTAPINSAPNNNTTGYIDTSTSNQTKSGLLGAGNLYSNNNIFAGANSFSQNYPGTLTGGSVSSTWFCLPIDTTGGTSGSGAIGFIKKIIYANFVNAATTNPSANADCITKWADILTNNNILSLPTGTILGQTLYWDTTAPAKWKVNNIFNINPTTNVASVTGKLNVSSDVTLNGNITAPTLASKTLCTDATGKFIACTGGTANPGGVLPLGTSEGQTLYWSNTTPVQWKATDVLKILPLNGTVITKNAKLDINLLTKTGVAGRNAIFINSSSDNVNSTFITNTPTFTLFANRIQYSGNPAGPADIIARDYSGRNGTFSSLDSATNPGVIYPALVCKQATGKLFLCPSQCYDHVDNDSDGFIDFPADPGCTSRTDNSEIDPVPPPPIPQCSDSIDNDGDGLTDYVGGDFGCSSVNDNDEIHAPIVQVLVSGIALVPSTPITYTSTFGPGGTTNAMSLSYPANIMNISYGGIVINGVLHPAGLGYPVPIYPNVTNLSPNTICMASAKELGSNNDVSVLSGWTGVKNPSNPFFDSRIYNFGVTQLTLSCDADGNPATTGDIGSGSATVEINGSMTISSGDPNIDVTGSFTVPGNVPTFSATLIGPGGAGAAYPNNGQDASNTMLMNGSTIIAIAHGGSGGGNSASCGVSPSAPCGGDGSSGSGSGSFGGTTTKGCGGKPGGGAPLCAGTSLNALGTKKPGYGGNGQINHSGGGGAGAIYINGVFPNPGTTINYIIGRAGIGFGNVNDGGPGDIKISW